jgi:mono/diheme cytochrome c family protein
MRFWLIALCFLIAGLTAFFFVTSEKAIPRVTRQNPTFESDLVARGESLAAIGNCDICHTAEAGLRLAGGRAIPTPFGTVYSPNITPDPDTGLGAWSEAAFQRAMRDGISRDGRHLYPAFPYDHFTIVTAADTHALFTYLESRPSVKAPPHENTLWPPLKIRRLVAIWNWLFLKRTAQPDDPNRSSEWNRGAYLVNGLGHCGACHTPRNILGAERSGHALAGGRAEGWDAYALDGASPSPIAWDADSVATFLKTGSHPQHGNARGPMVPVTEDLGRVTDADLHAIATYIVSNMQAAPKSFASTPAKGEANERIAGAAIYAASCAFCHSTGDAPPFGGLTLSSSTALNAPDPRNIILVTLAGLPAADGRAAGMMPGFDGAISDEDLAVLLEFMRQRFSAQPPWHDLSRSVTTARRALNENRFP